MRKRRQTTYELMTDQEKADWRAKNPLTPEKKAAWVKRMAERRDAANRSIARQVDYEMDHDND